jgi:hypothetical protein
MQTKELKEDSVVTTTDNGGMGLDYPKLPIKPKTILKRYKEFKAKQTKSSFD